MLNIKEALLLTTTEAINYEITHRRTTLTQLVGRLYSSIVSDEIIKLESRLEEIKELEMLGYRAFTRAYKLTDVEALKTEVVARLAKGGEVLDTDIRKKIDYEISELTNRIHMLEKKPQHEELVNQFGVNQESHDITVADGKTIAAMKHFESDGVDQVLLIVFTDGTQMIVKAEAYNDDYGGLKWILQ